MEILEEDAAQAAKDSWLQSLEAAHKALWRLVQAAPDHGMYVESKIESDGGGQRGGGNLMIVHAHMVARK
jgi:hypothetical protein